MTMQVTHRRLDGTFVGTLRGLPYHFAPGDPLFDQASVDGADAPLEPQPAQPTAEQALAAWRARAVLTRLQFGLQALLVGVMTTQEAEGFLGPRTVPQIGEAALLKIADANLRTVARMRLVGFERLERNDTLLVPFQAAVEWTDAQVDEFFQAGMLL